MSIHFTRQQFVILEHSIEAIEMDESRLWFVFCTHTWGSGTQDADTSEFITESISYELHGQHTSITKSGELVK